MAQAVSSHDRVAERSLAVLQYLFGDYHPRDFTMRLWDGSIWEAEVGQPTRFTLVLRHPGALRRMLWSPSEIRLSEAYLYDDFDVEGDITALLALADDVFAKQSGIAQQLKHAIALLTLPMSGPPRMGRRTARLSGALHSKERDRRAILYHYDVSNAFFALWLDRSMVYSCAYFIAASDGIDQAQEQKLDYICRKLRLRPGQRLLDIGCGWGSLVIHAARNYGVEALGITLSQAQVDYANHRIAETQLSGRCRVENLDYRDLDTHASFDRVVSVGMFEHVGEKMLVEYFRRAWAALRPGGVFLNHGIAFSAPRPQRSGPTFFDSYVFPDGELVPISTTLRAAEANGFEVRDVESLREHYALTLRHWLRRLEASGDEARRLTDEVTYRIWRLYLAAAMHQFVTGRTNLYQVLLSKPGPRGSELPLTRADWYATAGR